MEGGGEERKDGGRKRVQRRGNEGSFPVGRKCDGLLVLAEFLCPPETHNIFLMFCGGFYRNFYASGKIILFLKLYR